MKLFDHTIKAVTNGLYKVEFKGKEKFVFDEPSIIMPNHTSLADAAILAMNLPKEVYFVVNTQIAKKYKFFLKGRNYITVDPTNPYSVRKMVKVVKEGKPLVIFPEGRITRTGGLMKMYQGISYIAIKTGAKIFPVMIDGLEQSKFSYLGEKVETKTFPKVKINVGEAFKIPKKEGVLVKKQKEESAEKILKVLQEERFKIKQKNEVNLFNELVEAANIYGDKLEIAEDINGSITYKKLLLGTYVLSRKLKKIIKKQEQNIGVLLPNSIGHAVTLFSLFKNGHTPAILNFSVGKQSIKDNVETASLKTVLTSKVFIEKGKLEHLIEGLEEKNIHVIYLEDVKESLSKADKVKGLVEYKQKKLAKTEKDEVILFTSGSESKPKGVILTHENIYSNVYQARSIIDFTSKDKILNALPMFHSFGLTAGTFLPLLLGVPVYLYPTPLHYRVIPEIAYNNNATIMFGTSTFLSGYGRYAHPYDFYSLRYVFAGAEKLKPEVSNMWFEKFGIRIFEGYGITETAPILSLNTPLAYKKGTVGRFVPGMEYKLEKVEGIDKGGNLFVKGPNVMKGYLIHGKGYVPGEEWYNTGDVVEVDREGFITIKSRLKRFAKIGGEMMSLNLVEEVASSVFDTEEVAAVTIPDKRKGEQIVLFTTAKETDKSSIQKHIKEKDLSALLMPKMIKQIDKIPVLGSGKTDYVSLEKLANS